MFVSDYELARIRKMYPVGSMVELVSMDDKQAPPPGTKGTVRIVDDIGTVHCDWDNGSGLGFVPGEDIVRKVADADE